MIASSPQFFRPRIPLVYFVKWVGGVAGGDKPTQGTLVRKLLSSIFVRWIGPARENREIKRSKS